MIIAVDFDGTLVEHRYPLIGDVLFDQITKITSFQYLNLMREKFDAKIILWTCREGKELKEAIDFSQKHGVVFNAINENINDDLTKYNLALRKIYADIYIDDRNLGGISSWGNIYEYVEKFYIEKYHGHK